MSYLEGLTRITDYYFDEDFDLTGFEFSSF